MESVFGLLWNQCSACRGMTVRLGVEYATSLPFGTSRPGPRRSRFETTGTFDSPCAIDGGMITNSHRLNKLCDSCLAWERLSASLTERAIADEDGVATPTTAAERETMQREHCAKQGCWCPAA